MSYVCISEGTLIGNSDVDWQLLEASKSGDLEIVEVTISKTFWHNLTNQCPIVIILMLQMIDFKWLQ
jgi:hypothetical protein